MLLVSLFIWFHARLAAPNFARYSGDWDRMNAPHRLEQQRTFAQVTLEKVGFRSNVVPHQAQIFCSDIARFYHYGVCEMADTDAYYVLNVNEGIDILHKNPREQCNSQADEMKGRQTVDAKTVDALLSKDQARRCGHCW